MKNKKGIVAKAVFILSILIVFYGTTLAQKKAKVEDVKISTRFLTAGEISENGNLRGYYEFLAVDKPYKKNQNYQINLFDENLNKLNQVKFVEKENFNLLNGSYSNEELCFMFIDNINKAFEYKVFDMDGKLVSEHKNTLTKKDYKKLEKFGTTSQLVNIDGGGFISLSSLSQKGKLTFMLSKFIKGSKKHLTYQYNASSKFNFPNILGQVDNVIVIAVSESSKFFGNAKFSIVGIDADNMKQKFIKSSDVDGEYKFQPYSMVHNIEHNTIKISGTYFDVNGNSIKGSNGLAVWELDTAGVLLSEKYNAWGKDFKNFLSFKKNGKSKDLGFIKVHETFSTSDGKIFAIGEGYKKKFNPGGLVTLLLQYPCFLTKFQTTNLALFEFDENFKFLSGKELPKKKESFAAFGFSTMNVHKLSNYLPMFGYKYVQFNEEKDQFMLTFAEDRFKYFRGKRNNYNFNTCRYDKGKLTFDKFDMKNKKGYTMYMRNQYGKLAYYSYSSNKDNEFRIIKVK